MSERVGARIRQLAISNSLREALFLFVLLRIALTVAAVFVTFVFQVPPPCFHHGVVDWESMPVLYGEGPEARLLGVWQRWDACWYLRIAQFGYEPGEPGTAFFPLYPLAIRLLAPITLGNLALAALVITAISYVAAMTILHAMVSADLDRATAWRSMLYLSVFPTAFFLFAPFTESLFLALALAAIFLVRRAHQGYAVPFALLAGLTRPQGILLAVPLAWEAVLMLRAHRFRAGHRRSTVLSLAAAGAPVVGFAGFALYAELATGVSPFEANRQHWGYSNALPWEVLGNAWQWIIDPANQAAAGIQAMTALHLVLMVIFVSLFALGVRMLPLTYSLYVAPQLLTILLGGPVTPLASASRYMLTMFPVFVVLGRLGRNRHFHTAWLAASLLGLGILFTALLTNFSVG